MKYARRTLAGSGYPGPNGPSPVDDPTKVELTGYSFASEDLGDFLSRLASSLIFRDVVLKFANETEEPRPEDREKGAVRVIHFQLICSFSGG